MFFGVYILTKKYSTSPLMKLLTLGLYRHAIELDEETVRLDMFNKINISDIVRISYEKIPAGYSWSYTYAFHLSNGMVRNLPHSKMEGKTIMELLNDLKQINPNTIIDKEIIANISNSKRKLKLNFNPPPKGQRMSMDKAFGQQSPTLDAIFGFTIIFTYMLFPWLFYSIGEMSLTSLHGANYETYRIILFVLSGISVATLLMNLFVALASQYFG